MDGFIGSQRYRESVKAEVGEQVEGVLSVFGLLSMNELNLSCIFEVAY